MGSKQTENKLGVPRRVRLYEDDEERIAALSVASGVDQIDIERMAVHAGLASIEDQLKPLIDMRKAS